MEDIVNLSQLNSYFSYVAGATGNPDRETITVIVEGSFYTLSQSVNDAGMTITRVIKTGEAKSGADLVI